MVNLKKIDDIKSNESVIITGGGSNNKTNRLNYGLLSDILIKEMNQEHINKRIKNIKDKMNVNFNNLRKQAIYSYNRLVKKLNESKIRTNQYAIPNEFDDETNINGYLLVDSENIEQDLRDLKMLISTIASVYEEGNSNFSDVYSELYPDDNKEMEDFDVNFEEL